MTDPPLRLSNQPLPPFRLQRWPSRGSRTAAQRSARRHESIQLLAGAVTEQQREGIDRRSRSRRWCRGRLSAAGGQQDRGENHAKRANGGHSAHPSGLRPTTTTTGVVAPSCPQHGPFLMTALQLPEAPSPVRIPALENRNRETAPYHADMTSVCALERAACSLGDFRVLPSAQLESAEDEALCSRQRGGSVPMGGERRRSREAGTLCQHRQRVPDVARFLRVVVGHKSALGGSRPRQGAVWPHRTVLSGGRPQDSFTNPRFNAPDWNANLG